MKEVTVSKSEARATEEYLILVNYIKEQPHGSVITYNQVEHETGVTMNVTGKEKLRRAILKNKREYTTIRNVGYELGNARKSKMIISLRLRRIDSQVRRGRRAHNSLTQSFSQEFTSDESQAMAFANTILGATEKAIEESVSLYSKPKKQIANTKSPVLPEGV